MKTRNSKLTTNEQPQESEAKADTFQHVQEEKESVRELKKLKTRPRKTRGVHV